MSDNANLAWAAGLFEGEGHFTVRRKGNGYRAHFEMGLTTTDQDVAERFFQIAQCGNLRNIRIRNAKPHWKAQHNWTCGGVQAHAFAERLTPYLGARRLGRYHEILEIIADTQPIPRPCECCNNTFEPTRFARERFCSDRCRDRAKYLNRKYGVTSEAAFALRIPGTSPHAIR